MFDGKTGFDILFENTDENHLKMELDCYWAAYTGNDPLEIIEKYATRCVSLHIKDMKVEGDQPYFHGTWDWKIFHLKSTFKKEKSIM